MKVVIQRVSKCELSIDGKIHSKIGKGLLILLGIHLEDSHTDIEIFKKKIPNLRIFGDEDGKMNLSVMDIKGEIMIVSQFTLFADTKKGNRPSFLSSAKPAEAIPLYNLFIQEMEKIVGSDKIKTGIFGADMKLNLLNDGPVTIIIDSKE